MRKIVGFRNQIAHGYDTLDLNQVDDVIQEQLPTLLRDVETILADSDEPATGGGTR